MLAIMIVTITFFMLFNTLDTMKILYMKLSPKPDAIKPPLKNFGPLGTIKKDMKNMIDVNKDGILSMTEMLEAPGEMIIEKSTLLKRFLEGFKAIFTQNFLQKFKSFTVDVRNLMSPIDFLLLASFILIHKKALQLLYEFLHSKYNPLNWLIKSSTPIPPPTYKDSFVGHIESAVTLLVYFPFVLYLADIFSLIGTYLGFIPVKLADLSQPLTILAIASVCGTFFTRAKDWLLFKQRKGMKNPVDPTRFTITDEVTSLIIWLTIGVICMEFLSLELGFALGSLFAVGGIGSASVILALRSTMENIIGGVLLKYQDKFRVNEEVRIPGKGEGIVSAINHLNTKIRLSDNSEVSIPNAVFIQGEVINWSRTPYRQFKTSFPLVGFVPEKLPFITEKLRQCLIQMDDVVESRNRDVVVLASTFRKLGRSSTDIQPTMLINSSDKETEVLVEVEAHLKAVRSEQLAQHKTLVISNLVRCMQKIQNGNYTITAA